MSAQPSPGEGTDVPQDPDLPAFHTTAGKLADLDRRLDEAVHAGSAKAGEKQHAKGRKTARERIELLFDEGSFVELDELARHRSVAFGLEKNRPYGDGVVTGYGTIDGRPVLGVRHEIIGTLEQGGYDGFFSLEMFNADLWRLPAKEAARRCYESLLPLCD